MSKARRISRNFAEVWGGRWDLNPRPSEPQSDVLPLNYAHRRDLNPYYNVFSGALCSEYRLIEPWQEFGISASTT